MLKTLLVATLILSVEGPQQTGIIAGTVIPPAQQIISQPVSVVLLSPRYMDLWNSEVQKRLDLYWQQYQYAFRNRKELFAEFSKRAHKDATSYVVTRMRRDPSTNISEYLMEIPAGTGFEFKNLPFGEYRVLALGKVGNQEVIWQELVHVHSPIPHFLELKTRIP